ncbi:MAG: aminotransferase class I/II-fold pyridoxal phosphate-dependent enzyme [Bacteroidaceae bacterium]|nr:aminotransferase class I/II-fold pyridoxal phosphate-dependent enzyme [Bacteroidaceae bacterium]
MIEGHGDDSYHFQHEIVINFSSNIYAHANLKGLYAYLHDRMEVINSYPEPEAFSLEAELADLLHINKDSVLVTNGATEAIYLIAHAYRGLYAQVLQPTFREYADACVMNSSRVGALWQLPSEREHYLLDDEVRILWLCNPNNPTGNLVPNTYLQALIEANPQVLFIIDQSYEYFVQQPLFTASEAMKFENVLLLHSLTKRYCVPGLRLGYITAAPHIMRHLRTYKMPWSVNALAIEAGHYLLHNDIEGLPSVDSYLREAQRLRDNLNALGALQVWETSTHFMLVQLRYGKASALKNWLANEYGILIRDASNFEGLDARFFRIAAQKPEENDKLVEAIQKWIIE